MILNQILLEAATQLTKKQIAAKNLGANMRKRERNAVAKAHERLLANPYIHFDNGKLLIMSEPSGNETEIKFYLTDKDSCRQIEPNNHLCPAFWDGFPCWHRASFDILENYIAVAELSR